FASRGYPVSLLCGRRPYCSRSFYIAACSYHFPSCLHYALPIFSNSIDTSNLSVGQHTLYVAEDFWHNAVGESNEPNNVKAITFNVTTPNASLAVDSVTASPSAAQRHGLAISYLFDNLAITAART